MARKRLMCIKMSGMDNYRMKLYDRDKRMLFQSEMPMRKEERNTKMTFDRKIVLFITRALIISTMLLILVSGVSTMISLINKSAQMAMKEVDAMAANTEDNFMYYYDLIWSINLNDHIQKYLKEESNQQEAVENAYSVLDNICNMSRNVNFISIEKEENDGFLIKGNSIPNWLPDYKKQIKDDYNNSINMRNNVMRMVYSKTYSTKEEYSLSIYYPLYSNSVIGDRLGTLCINVSDSNLLQLMSDKNSGGEFAVDTYFVHKNGSIIVSANENEIGRKFEGLDFPNIKQGKISGNTGIIIYEKLSGWDFYYVTHIGWWDLAKDSVWTVLVLLILLLGLLALFIRLARQMVEKAYAPWGNIVTAMGKVSEGELETRVSVKEDDPDMKVVEKGFNSMMEKIVKLMEQIKEEEQQMNQIRLDALHSQIQPHFLYNTLDCIHWQAVVSGNQDISNMVKALATYYRICLSKGKDIITLQQELDYVKNYLFIQRMRYGEILNYEIEEEPGLEKAVIPKLTLQPLVENAIYHGIKSMEGREGHIVIRVRGVSADIEILVEDDGAGMPKERVEEINGMIKVFDEQFGYGVRSVNRRIQLFCGEEYGLTYMRNDKGGITVKILIPNTHQSQTAAASDGINERTLPNYESIDSGR